ncbi:MAG: PspC domain-containing protein [Nigerium sp.]|nr:PspC domain-containing protein [Nigerium sp.]
MSQPPVTRDRSEARFRGVCAALARAWHVDAVIVRVAFVVLTFVTGGFAVFAYLALWALIPERGSTTEPVRRLLPFTRSWSTATLVIVVVATAAAVGGVVTGSGAGAFVLIALAWIILRFGFAGRRSGPSDSSVPPAAMPAPRTPFERTAVAWQQRLDNVAAGRPVDWSPELDDPDPAGLYGAATGVEGQPRTGAAARRRGRRTWFGILVGMGVAGAGLAAASALGLHAGGLAWSASTLLVLGIALLWSARPLSAAWGRPRLLLPLTALTGVVTILLLAGSVVAPPQFFTGVGRGPDVAVTERILVGGHVVDLSTHAVTADETQRFRVDVGSLEIVVPGEGNVVVYGQVGAGEIIMPGSGEVSGVNATKTWTRIDTPGEPILTIDASVGLGTVEVLR